MGRTLSGEDKEQFRVWLKPLGRQLKNPSNLQVIRQLEAVLAKRPAGEATRVGAQEVACRRAHQERMDHRAGRRADESIGSGAMESTGHQPPDRLHRPSQYWSRSGDESRLCLETFWRHDRGFLLFPHSTFDSAEN